MGTLKISTVLHGVTSRSTAVFRLKEHKKDEIEKKY